MEKRLNLTEIFKNKAVPETFLTTKEKNTVPESAEANARSNI